MRYRNRLVVLMLMAGFWTLGHTSSLAVDRVIQFPPSSVPDYGLYDASVVIPSWLYNGRSCGGCSQPMRSS